MAEHPRCCSKPGCLLSPRKPHPGALSPCSPIPGAPHSNGDGSSTCQQFLQEWQNLQEHCLPVPLAPTAGQGSLCRQVKTGLDGRELKVKGPCNNFRVPEAPHGSPGIISKGNVLEPELQSKQLQERGMC